MITNIRNFIARIIDTRVSEAVTDVLRSMNHLEINNDDRHKVILNCLDRMNDAIRLNGDNAHNATIAVRDAMKSAIADNRDAIVNVIASNKPVAGMPVPPTTKAACVGSALVNETLKRSKEWEALSVQAKVYFVSMVKGRYNDIQMQGFFEVEFFRQYQPVIVMLSTMKDRAADFTDKECL